MDKIYSRKRIHIPRVYFTKIHRKQLGVKEKIAIKLIAILIIGILVMFKVINSINPIIDKLCFDVSKNKATSIANKKTTEIMSKYSYNDIVTIYRDGKDNITMIKSNTNVINDITSKVAIAIQEELEINSESKTQIKIGSLTGVKILSGIGPSIPLKLSTTGSVVTKVRSEFESKGINQTIHRLYLDVICNVSILTPYDIIEDSIKNEILIIENVIVGIVPSTYYNLEGMEKNDLVDIIE